MGDDRTDHLVARDHLGVGVRPRSLVIDGCCHLVDLADVLAREELLQPTLAHLVHVVDHREVALVDLTNAQALLLGQVAVEALKQCVQLLLRRGHVGVAHVARRRLVLHGFGQLVQLALVQLVDGLAEQVVVAAHPLVACIQVALAVLGCAFFARIGEELLGQRTGGGADALGEDGVGRQHHGRRTLGNGVDGPRALGHPGALVEDLGHGACPC